MSDKLHDMTVELKGIFPLFVFSDPFKGKFSQGKFFAFVGAYPPFKIVAGHEDNHKDALNALRNGLWKKSALEEALKKNTSRKIGFGIGNTPSEAFRQAIIMSGDVVTDVSNIAKPT